MFYKNYIKYLSIVFISISASNLTVLYIAKTISNLQINLRFFRNINTELVIFILCIFFMYFAVIFFHYNRNYIISKFQDYLNKNIFEKSLMKSIYLNNKYNSNLLSKDIIKNYTFLEKYLTRNIDKIFYFPWIFLYLFFLKKLNADIFTINIIFILLAVVIKVILFLLSNMQNNAYLKNKTPQSAKIFPNINVFYNLILANFDAFKDFHFFNITVKKARDFFIYFFGFLKSANIIIILIYNSIFIQKNIQNIIIIYILTNHIIFFLERTLSFKPDIKQFLEKNEFFKKINTNNQENFYSKIVFKKTGNVIISAKNIYFKYYDTEHFVIKNLSLDIFENKIHLITGANNAGKSTLIKLLTGSLNFEKGDIIKQPDKTICVCNDDIIFFEKLNFLSNLIIFNNNYEVDKKFLDFLVKKLNFLDDIKHYPGQLKAAIKDQNRISDTLKKKTTIIRTLFSNKDILFFDIDLANFDDKFILNFKEVLQTISKTIIISTNIKKMFDISDIIYNLEKN